MSFSEPMTWRPLCHPNRSGKLNRLPLCQSARVSRAGCETLEPRQLLATYTYTVPAGHIAAYLQSGPMPGQVQVRLDSPEGDVARTFTNTAGMDVIDCSVNADFLFVDQVPAALKPAADAQGDNGTKVQGGTRGTLRIEAGEDDTLIRFLGGSAAGSTIEVTDHHGNVGRSRLGSGLRHLQIRTNDVEAGDYYPGGGTDVIFPFFLGGFSLAVDTGRATYSRVRIGESQTVFNTTIKTGAGSNIVDVWKSAPDVDFGPGSGSGNGLGLGNILNLHGPNGGAELRPLGGSDVVVIDEVNVFDDASVIVTGASTIGELRVRAGGVASIEARLMVAGAFDVDGSATFTGTSAPSFINNFGESDGTVELIREANIVVANPSYINHLVLDGDPFPYHAALTFQTTGSRVGTLSLLEGLVTLQERAGSPPSESPRVLTVGVLYTGDPNFPRGVLDLKDNALVIDHPGPSPIHILRTLVTRAYENGTWNGLGVGSSIAAAVPNTGVGFAESTDLFSTFPATFIDEQVDDTSVLVRYTHSGDANLDGLVNLDDFNRLAANFGESKRTWIHGDSNYDRIVNQIDFKSLATNFGRAGLGRTIGEEDLESDDASRIAELA